MFDVRVIEIKNAVEAREALQTIGADDPGVKIMTPKTVFRTVKIRNISPVIANIVKQEMLSKGGEAAVTRAAVNESSPKTDVIIAGTLRQYQELMCKLKMQPFKIPQLAREIGQALTDYDRRGPGEMDCRGYKLPLGQRTLVMGILNVTPDSFSDGGRFFNTDIAVAHAHEMAEQGADIIDIGAESTRPGYTRISDEEEMDRLLPVVERLVREVNLPVSVDTYKSVVGREALKLGAHILNDIWGLKADPALAQAAAEYNVPLILMHNQEGTEYTDLMGDIIASLRESIRVAEEAGVAPHNIIVDPGIGFGKDYEQNLEVMHRMGEIRALGKPVLLGTSRKSLIAKTLDLPPDQRVEGTAATVTLGIAYGADIVRVHDVKEMVRVVKMTDAMVRR